MPKIMFNGVEYAGSGGGGGGSTWITDIPEMHRNIFRGQSLGSSVTAAQLAAIEDGSFDDLYVGDYWTIPITIGGTEKTVHWRIADMNYFIGTGEDPDTPGHMNDTNHLVIVPDETLGTTIITSGNYRNNAVYTTELPALMTDIAALFSNAVLPYYHPHDTNTDVLRTGDLMSVQMLVGTNQFASQSTPQIDRGPFALFALAPKFISVRGEYYVTRSTDGGSSLVDVNKYGEIYKWYINPSSAAGIRPFFLIGVSE